MALSTATTSATSTATGSSTLQLELSSASTQSAVVSAASNSTSTPRLVLAGFIAGTTVMGTHGLMVPFVFTKSPLPYMATPGNKVRKALEFVMAQHHHHHHKRSAITTTNNNNLTFVDMGSGDGEAVWQATQLGYKHAIGIELNWTLVTLSRLRRRWFWTKDQQSRSTFLYQDMLVDDDEKSNSSAHYLSSCHACMIFGVQPLMETISRKLARQCQPGTHILSYRFQLPTATTEQPDLLNADIVYNEQEMRIYKILSNEVLQQQQQQEQKD